MIRAKFMVLEIAPVEGNATARRAVLAPQYDPEIPEDARFQRATPSGRLELVVDNPAALDQLQAGRFFYVDLSAAD